MSTSTQNHSPASRPSSSAAAELVGRAMAGLGVIAGMGLYLAISPFITLGTGFVAFVVELRDGFARPRAFIGARHGFPFLDRPATAVADEVEPTAESPGPIPTA